MNSIKNKIAFLLIFTLSLTKVQGQQGVLEINKTPLTTFFESATYKGGIQNWRFAQDTSNILYVANSFGLLEFDGADWKRYDVPKSTKTRALYIDENNAIFVGGQGQLGFFQFNEDGLKFTSLLDKLQVKSQSIDEVWDIYAYKGHVRFQTSDGLFEFKDSTLTNLFPERKITGSFVMPNKTIIQEESDELFELIDQRLVPYKLQSGTLDKIVSAIEHNSITLVFCENGHVFEISENQVLNERKDLSSLFSKPLINVAVSLSSGDIAIGTQNDGLFILDNNYQVTRHLTKKQGLDHRTVYSLYEDHFSNLWVGLNNGISYIELGSPLSLINEELGLEGTGYTAMVHDSRLYLGTNNGLFAQQKESRYSEYEIIPGTEGIVYGLNTINNKLLMSHHTGAYEVQNNKIQHFFTDYGTWKFLKIPNSNKIIGGTYHGFRIFQADGNDWKLNHGMTNFDESSRVFEWENPSTLWMTHGYKGAFKISFNEDYTGITEIKQYDEDDGFPSNLLISVYNLNDRLVFTSEHGIYAYDTQSDTFVLNEFLTDLFGMNHVSKITSFGNGHILFISNDELGMLKQKAFGKYEKEVNIFKRINKYLSNDLENINVIDDENVLIGAKEGFIHYNPSLSFTGEQSFKTLIRSITVTDEKVATRTLPSSFFTDLDLVQPNGLKFEFASPYFDGFKDIQYSFRLTPYDKEWSEWSTSNNKEYTNLPSGKYTFEVKALNIYGSEGDIASTSFVISSPWYKTNLAYVIYTSIGLLTFGFVSFLQDRKYRSEKLKLSESKEQAIKEMGRQISDISEKSQKEIEDLKNQKLRSEIHHKNNQLASVTMHLINKNEFVQEVRKKIDQMLKEKSTSPEQLRKIIKTIDQNHAEDDSWDQFSYHFDQVHGDFLKKLVKDVDKLTPQETKLAAYLRMNMSSKEIANLMGISVRGVELARYRLRKKLGLDRDQNLNDYLMQV